MGLFFLFQRESWENIWFGTSGCMSIIWKWRWAFISQFFFMFCICKCLFVEPLFQISFWLFSLMSVYDLKGIHVYSGLHKIAHISWLLSNVWRDSFSKLSLFIILTFSFCVRDDIYSSGWMMYDIIGHMCHLNMPTRYPI